MFCGLEIMRESRIEVAIALYLVCWLIRRKAQVRIPGQTSKRNMKKLFLRRFPLNRLLAKTLTVNKPAMKKFLKNLSYKINAHNMSGVRS